MVTTKSKMIQQQKCKRANLTAYVYQTTKCNNLHEWTFFSIFWENAHEGAKI